MHCILFVHTQEETRGHKLSAETIRTRLKRLIAQKDAYKQLFNVLKDEFDLKPEMLISFEDLVMEKSTFDVSGGDDSVHVLRGLDAIDESMKNNN